MSNWTLFYILMLLLLCLKNAFVSLIPATVLSFVEAFIIKGVLSWGDFRRAIFFTLTANSISAFTGNFLLTFGGMLFFILYFPTSSHPIPHTLTDNLILVGSVICISFVPVFLTVFKYILLGKFKFAFGYQALIYAVISTLILLFFCFTGSIYLLYDLDADFK